MFKGALVALVTPFQGGQIDEKALRFLIEKQILGKISGIVPCGTTGEASTLILQEWRRVIEVTVEQVNRRIPVIAGCGTNATVTTIERTRLAREIGADGGLVITPYYNRPTQQGLFEHFAAVARSVELPLVLYNVPSRTGVNLAPETLEKLMPFETIVAVKEATGSMTVLTEIFKLCGTRYTLLSGEDATILPFMAIGGHGVISVVANLVPHDVAALCQAIDQGEFLPAQSLHLKLYPLVKAIFVETNPIPVKAALGLLGWINPELRLPLTPPSKANLETLKRAMEAYGLFKPGGGA